MPPTRPAPDTPPVPGTSSVPLAAKVLTALPPLALAPMVWAWGVDLPYWDQWALVPHLEAVARGDWPWADLWRQHNEHRLFFPQVIMLGLAQLTDWNIRVEMGLSLLLAVGTFFSLAWLVRQTLDTPPPWLWPVLSLLVFAPSQWENWIWGWQIQIFLSALAIALGLALLVRAERPTRLAGGALCGLVASFSFANGLLFWGLALPLVLRPAKRRWPRTTLWLALALGVAALYFHGFGFGERPPFFTEGVPRTLKLFGGYVSIYLGAPIFAFHGHLALYGGFLALVALAIRFGLEVRPRPVEWLFGSRLPWLLLAAYAGISALVTASGRLHFGIGQALTSRYITLSSLFWIAVVVLIAFRGLEADDGKRSPIVRRLGLVGASILLLGVLLSSAHGASRMAEVGRERLEIRQQLLGDPESADLLLVYPDPEEALERARTLEELSLGPYR